MSYIFEDINKRYFGGWPLDEFDRTKRDISLLRNITTEKDGVITAKIELPGFGQEDIKSIEFNKKTKVLSFKLECDGAKKNLDFSIGKVIPDSIKVVSYNKGILIVEAKKEAVVSSIIKIL